MAKFNEGEARGPSSWPQHEGPDPEPEPELQEDCPDPPNLEPNQEETCPDQPPDLAQPGLGLEPALSGEANRSSNSFSNARQSLGEGSCKVTSWRSSRNQDSEDPTRSRPSTSSSNAATQPRSRKNSTGRRSRHSGSSTCSSFPGSSSFPLAGSQRLSAADAGEKAPRSFIARSDHEKWVSTHTSGDSHPVSKCPALLANVRLIRAKAFLGLSLPLPRSQDLPDECFGVPTGQDLLVAVSHAWRNQAHPDPTGRKHAAVCNHLRSVLEEGLGEVFMFFDFLSMPQRPFRQDQADRTETQRAQFELALERMHLAFFVADRIIHLEGVDGPVPGEGDMYCLESCQLAGATFGQLAAWVQVVGSSSDASNEKYRSSFSKEWSLFDRILKVEGKLVKTLEEVEGVGRRRDGRSVELVRYPFGRVNDIPAAERGWIFLERFLTSVKCAMLDEAEASKAVLTNCTQIRGEIETCTRRLREAAESDLAKSNEAFSPALRERFLSGESDSGGWSSEGDSSPRAADDSNSCHAATSDIVSTFSLGHIDSFPRSVGALSRVSLRSDPDSLDGSVSSPCSPSSRGSRRAVSPSHASSQRQQSHHFNACPRHSHQQGQVPAHQHGPLQQLQQRPLGRPGPSAPAKAIVSLDPETPDLAANREAEGEADSQGCLPNMEGAPAKPLGAPRGRAVVSLDAVSLDSRDASPCEGDEEAEAKEAGAGQLELDEEISNGRNDSTSEFFRDSLSCRDCLKRRELVENTILEEGDKDEGIPKEADSFTSRFRREVEERQEDTSPLRMPALNSVLQGYLQELATKQFSASSTDKLLLDGRNSVGSGGGALPDQVVVGAIMESFVCHLSYHWTAEVDGQRARAAKVHRVFEAAAAWLLEWEGFSPQQYEKIRLAPQQSSWWVLALILAICLPAAALVLCPFKDYRYPWEEQTPFFLVLILASCTYSMLSPTFLACLLDPPSGLRLHAATAAYAATSGLVMGLAVWGSSALFDEFPPPNVNASAPAAAMICLPLLFFVLPHAFRQNCEVRRKFRQVILCIISHGTIFFSIFPMLSNLLAVTPDPFIQAAIILGFLVCKLASEWLGRRFCLSFGADAMPPVIFGASFGFELQVCIAFGSGFHPLVFLLLLSIDMTENGYHLYCLHREDTGCRSALGQGRRAFIVSTLLIREFVEVLVVFTFGIFVELICWANRGASLLLCTMQPGDVRQMRAYILVDLLVEVCIFACTVYMLHNRGLKPFKILKGLLISYWKVFAAFGCATMQVCWISQHTHIGAWHREISSGFACLSEET